MDDDMLEHDAIASFDDYKTHLLSRATDIATTPSKYTTIPSDTQCTLKKQLGSTNQLLISWLHAVLDVSSCSPQDFQVSAACRQRRISAPADI
tara:strand:- start:125 stop:403 length:279 start_codon:yes stop_codon:yes gene_type:complete